MILEENTITSKSSLSDDKNKRYLLNIQWDNAGENLCIVMLSAGRSNGVCNDKTTNLVMKNAVNLGYGSVSILNLFASVDGTKENVEDKENLSVIDATAKETKTIVFAVGTASKTNKAIAERQKDVLGMLKKYEKKLFCISDADGKKFYHPLCPKVADWNLVKTTVKELYAND